MSTARHLYQLPQRLTKTIHKSKAAAYSYDLFKEEAKELPRHYIQRCVDFHQRDPKPVHFIPKEGKWEYQSNTTNIIPVQNVYIPLIFPEEANAGLWGGEGVIEGYRKGNKRRSVRIPKIWKPQLMTRALYSEILDQWFEVTVTFTTLDQIDEAMGFDFYILKTHERDINSKLGMMFRRKMLTALARRDFYHDDPKKKDRIIRKYAEFIIPEEEVEWIGLTVSEALQKAREMEKEVKKPCKEQLSEDLILRLTGHTVVEEEQKEEEGVLEPYKEKSQILGIAKKLFKPKEKKE